MTPLEFIASLQHGEAKAAALTVFNLMTPTGNERLVGIQPRYLKLMKFHLSQYLNTLCEQAEEGEKVKDINELGFLDYAIDILLRVHCNDTVGKIGDTP